MLAGLDAFNPTFLADLNATENRITAANKEVTSGFRVNVASDDPAAVGSIVQYQSRIDQATQVQTNLNWASTVTSSADGALSSAATLLDRAGSIAAEGSSGTATATTRTVLAQQVQSILQQLVGVANTSVQGQYIFGGDDSATQPYTLDFNVPGGVVRNNTAANTATIQNAAGAVIIPGLTAQQMFGNSGTDLAGNSQRVDSPGAVFVKGLAGTDDETFQFSVFANGHTSTVTATAAASTGGQSLTSVLSSLNSQLAVSGIVAGVDSNGLLQFSSSNAFTVNESSASTGAQLLTSNSGAGTGVNAGNYTVAGQDAYSPAAGDTLQFQSSAGSVTVTLAASTNLAAAIAQINTATAGLGVYAVENSAGTGISFQGAKSFTITNSNDGSFAAAGLQTAVAPVNSSIFQTLYALGQALQNNDQPSAQDAALALGNSVAQLGQATARYGNTENWIQDAQDSATSLLVNLQTGLGGLRGADVATEATALTLDQTSMQAALAAHGSLQIKSLFSYLG